MFDIANTIKALVEAYPYLKAKLYQMEEARTRAWDLYEGLSREAYEADPSAWDRMIDTADAEYYKVKEAVEEADEALNRLTGMEDLLLRLTEKGVL